MLKKLIVYCEAKGGFERTVRYLSWIVASDMERPVLDGVQFFRSPPVVAVRRQPPLQPPGPENFVAHRLEVVFKRRRVVG